MDTSAIYNIIHGHASVRSFQEKQVPVEILDKILHAASRASSSGNMQAYSVIVTTDDQIKQEMFEPHFKQEMVLQAPVIMTFCADFYRMRQWLKLSDAPENFDNFMSFMIGAIDAVLASQNAVLAAEAEGLGVCYMGTTLASCLEISRILKCPENVMPVVGFALGYPAENPKTRDRLPLSGIVHRETYKEYSKEDILNIYREKEDLGMKRYMAVPELRDLVLAHDIKNLAQVYTKAKYTKESHVKYSEDVMACLQQQNFMNLQKL